MDDMVRASITVNSYAELWDAFKWFKESGLVDFIRIYDNLSDDRKDVVVLFNFENVIIGEM